jgi:hypothetical protein
MRVKGGFFEMYDMTHPQWFLQGGRMGGQNYRWRRLARDMTAKW